MYAFCGFRSDVADDYVPLVQNTSLMRTRNVPPSKRRFRLPINAVSYLTTTIVKKLRNDIQDISETKRPTVLQLALSGYC